ncbi:hypothetical protein H0H81_003575 [Sphagnurus paluster]|uniref:Altered inheritance of mitochondria protein 9, mitochondrial n=1 Tax=Sphagnurus paluster TaxID=117069 RepID=A0A9P7GMK3_9AGAR|nr:hypothetical protein H0H81_003575 [Sphagnurus paluster]
MGTRLAVGYLMRSNEKVSDSSLALDSPFTFTLGGHFNKIYLLELDNGVKATARIPGAIVGNIELSIVSEAATLSYLHDLGNIPVPKLLAWSHDSSSTNPVKWPYIVTEYTPGIPLSDVWPSIRGNPSGEIILLLMRVLDECTAPRMSQIGSLYFKEDVSPELQARPLFAFDADNSQDEGHISQKYRIGPIVDREWWRGARRHVESDRGPWPDLKSYITAAARLELKCISEGIDLDSPHVISQPKDIPELQDLLTRCIAAAPHLAPSVDPSLSAPSLTHPDLITSNIIIPSPTVMHGAKIIDWQGTIIAPFLMQPCVPPAIAYTTNIFGQTDLTAVPQLPDNFGTLSPDEQQYLTLHRVYAGRQAIFLQLVVKKSPRVGRMWALAPHSWIMAGLVYHICRSWASGPARLRQDLIDLEDNWEGISSEPCPYHFTPEDRARHEREYAAFERRDAAAEKLRLSIGCDPHGLVENDKWEEAKARWEEAMRKWDVTEEGTEFPFRDGALSYGDSCLC